MKAAQILNLIEIGAKDRARLYLKKLALKQRLPLLHSCFPITVNAARIQFFQEHFAAELVALWEAGFDYGKAEVRYRELLRSNK